MPDTVTITAPKTVTRSEVAPDRGWKAVLFNDEVTPLNVVIFGLQRSAGLSEEIAEAVALEAHQHEQAVVKRGLSEEDAKILCGGLRKWTRIDGICPGVTCEAQQDDE